METEADFSLPNRYNPSTMGLFKLFAPEFRFGVRNGRKFCALLNTRRDGALGEVLPDPATHRTRSLQTGRWESGNRGRVRKAIERKARRGRGTAPARRVIVVATGVVWAIA
jgi:hypothetical protein